MARADALETNSANVRRSVLSAFCTSLIGIGLARFAYTPLLPAVIDAHWFSPAAAAYLGAANLAGYLLGALLGRPLSARHATVHVLRVMMVLATASFIACGFPLGFAWFFAWRFAAGFAGGAMMVLAAPTVLAHIPMARRGLTGGFVFMGVGVGIIASGTLVPFLLRSGVQQAWFGIAALSAILTAVAWTGWPPVSHSDPVRAERTPRLHSPTLVALYIEYALNAGGWIPHMIFLVDYVAHGLGQGVAVGAEFWVVFGISAALGTILTGHVADRIGFKLALRLGFALQIVGLLIPASGMTSQPMLFLSSVIVGVFMTGTVVLVLGRIQELLPHQPTAQRAAWSVATIAFSICQAVVAYGFSYIFVRSGGDYTILFIIGVAAVSLALVIDLAAPQQAKTSH